jgi:uncharacterized membrane protein
MEAVVGSVLLCGVCLSVLLLLAGLLWHWASSGRLEFSYELPRKHFVQFALGEVAGGIRGGWSPDRLVNLGIIVLMLTPYLRVAFSVLFFLFVERNYKYGAIAGFVGAVLTYSLFLR